MKASVLRHGLNFWPPFLFSGIHVAALCADYRHAHVELRLRPWNRNYVGTHFGGSLFAMTDPFWMLLTMQSLGSQYWVWDKAGEIEFVKPGRGTVHADFRLTDTVLDELRAIAGEMGASVAQVALAWLLGRQAVASVILGASKPAQLADNLGAMDLTLDGATLARLDALTAPAELYPHWHWRKAADRIIDEALGGSGR